MFDLTRWKPVTTTAARYLHHAHAAWELDMDHHCCVARLTFLITTTASSSGPLSASNSIKAANTLASCRSICIIILIIHAHMSKALQLQADSIAVGDAEARAAALACTCIRFAADACYSS